MRPYFTIPSSSEQFDYARIFEIVGPCELWTGPFDKDGYGDRGKASSNRKAHRYAVEERIGRRLSPSEVVTHVCDAPACVQVCGEAGAYIVRGISYVRLGHLVIANQLANKHDATDKGRTARGARNGTAKLTDASVREIRARCAAGETQRSVARAFSISFQLVNAVVLRRSWKYLD